MTEYETQQLVMLERIASSLETISDTLSAISGALSSEYDSTIGDSLAHIDSMLENNKGNPILADLAQAIINR